MSAILLVLLGCMGGEQTADFGLAQKLESPDWNERHGALVALEAQNRLSPRLAAGLVSSLRYDTVVMSTSGPTPWTDATAMLLSHKEVAVPAVRVGLRGDDVHIRRHCALVAGATSDRSLMPDIEFALRKQLAAMSMGQDSPSRADLSALRTLVEAGVQLDRVRLIGVLMEAHAWKSERESKATLLGLLILQPDGPSCSGGDIVSGECRRLWRTTLLPQPE